MWRWGPSVWRKFAAADLNRTGTDFPSWSYAAFTPEIAELNFRSPQSRGNVLWGFFDKAACIHCGYISELSFRRIWTSTVYLSKLTVKGLVIMYFKCTLPAGCGICSIRY